MIRAFQTRIDKKANNEENHKCSRNLVSYSNHYACCFKSTLKTDNPLFQNR
jgi:hypothetical protein